MTRHASRSPVILAAILLPAACDVPSEAPILDSRWVVPGDETRISVADLLPAGVTAGTPPEAFAVEVAPATVDRTLGELCSSCQTLDGVVAPKPAFQAEWEARTALPLDVVDGELESGEVTIVVENGLGFDPLRPGGGETGTMTFDLISSPGPGDPGRVVGTVELDGAVTALPAGGSVSRVMDLAAGTLEPELTVRIDLESPDGDPVLIDADEFVRVTAVVDRVLMGSLSVVVADLTVTSETVDLDVGDVDRSVVDRLVKGAFILEIDNPWSIEVALSLRIAGTGIPTIRKSVVIPPDASTQRVSFTGEELRSFLGREGVFMEGDGVASATAGPVTVTPDQTLRLDSDLDLTVRIGD